MRLSLNWLKTYVDIEMAPEDLGHLLTMAGLEVESIEPMGNALPGILVARILSVKRHPKADRLFICQMDAGKGAVQVVSGAPNLKEGALVPLALPGTALPSGVIIKKSRFRGEMSMGMLLAEDEMGLTDDHTGIMILPGNLEPGLEISSAMSLEDFALDISLTPNRSDCASVIGIAREVAALTGQKAKLPETNYEESGPEITELASVTIDDAKGCPRYAAGMAQGVKLEVSPFWLRYRLYVSGIRAINNVVDITNYVLLEMGQPLHAFDYDRLKGHHIIVSRARENDRFTTLDEQVHTLSSEHLMICDGERQVALAGIMGGMNTEISSGTINVLIESAYFDPVTIRRGSKSLGLSTEASYRFERGIDIGGVKRALRRALLLIHDLAGARVSKGVIDVYPQPFEPPPIELRTGKTNDLLGTSLSTESIISYLESLEMDIVDSDGYRILVKPPTFRVDISREIDLVEEVARLEGYDRIPVKNPLVRPSEEGDLPFLVLRDRVGEIMSGLGFSEIITYSFISPDSADMLNAENDSYLRAFVTLRNPLTREQSVMRTSLIPGLLSTLKENIARGETDLKLFEWGNIFIAKDREALPEERLSFAAVMTGMYKNEGLHREIRHCDFYDLKGAFQVLFRSLGLRKTAYRRDQAEPWYHPGISCGIYEAGSPIGRLGQINPFTIDRFALKTRSVYLCEIDVAALAKKMGEEPIQFAAYSRFPAVIRDLSIVLDSQIESAWIYEIIEREGGKLVESIEIFDLYKGDKIGPSKRAISFRICYRSKESTLNGKSVNRLHEKVINRVLKETGGKLREA